MNANNNFSIYSKQCSQLNMTFSHFATKPFLPKTNFRSAIIKCLRKLCTGLLVCYKMKELETQFYETKSAA